MDHGRKSVLVEGLKGSGLVADETSHGYDDIFTITLVTDHSIGIGAYLVWLGECAAQVEGQPFIFTGALHWRKNCGYKNAMKGEDMLHILQDTTNLYLRIRSIKTISIQDTCESNENIAEWSCPGLCH